MIVIEPNKQLLVLRFSEYKKHNFIMEHSEIIDSYGEVWFLKLGKAVPEYRFEKIVSETAGVILKSPKSSGGKYYYCPILEIKNSDADNIMKFPNYYHDLMDEMFWYNLSGTWIKTNKFVEIPEPAISKFRLWSNNRILDKVLSETRTTMLYAFAEEKIEFN